MSQHFKSKYDQMRENSQSTDPESQMNDSSDNGPVRNICFVLEDRSMTFLNYGYLISGKINPEKDSLMLKFTSHEVIIEGRVLQGLFDELKTHKAALVTVDEERYKSLNDNSAISISTIEIKDL